MLVPEHATLTLVRVPASVSVSLHGVWLNGVLTVHRFETHSDSVEVAMDRGLADFARSALAKRSDFVAHTDDDVDVDEIRFADGTKILCPKEDA